MSALLQRLMAALWPLVPWIAVGVIAAATWHYLPVVGPAAQLTRASTEIGAWKAQSAEWERAARGWRSSFNASEILRRQETAEALEAVVAETERCAARVTEARQSARVIERIVTQEPTYDENRCPVRRLVDPDELRRALQPAG